MAFTGGSTSQDWVVEIQDRGPVDGSPASLSVVAVTAICRRVRKRGMVGKDIPVGGFGITDLFRPGKTNWEVDIDLLVPAASASSITEGNYVQIEYTIGSNTEKKYCGYAKNVEEGVDDDGETILTVTVKGPADGASTS